MNVLQNLTAIRKTRTAQFIAQNGVSPYTYSVLPDGAGGSINSSGLYTPNNYGIDTILVTDSDGEEVEKTILVAHPIILLCEILQKEMGLDDKSVYLYNQKYTIPKDYGLYISLAVLSSKPYTNINRFNSDTDKSDQWINMRDIVDMNIMSRDTSALYRKEEVLMALNSDYAHLQMTANSFKVAKLSQNFNNIGEVDGSAIPYRFNISMSLQYASELSKDVDYYDTFSEEYLTNE